MRIWHEELIPKLCRQHLLACWREGLGCYKIITEKKKGYRTHPAVKEFEKCPDDLRYRLSQIRNEMLLRGYNPKELPPDCELTCYQPKQWQSLEEQKRILKKKGCDCKI